MQKTAFPSRAKRLRLISQDMVLSQSYPLLKIAKIKKELFGELIENVNKYIHSNLTNFYSGEKFSQGKFLLKSQPKKIRGLPNITPNGLILPKQSTCSDYNKVHASIVKIVREFKLNQHAESVHAPINIRLIDGNKNNNDLRPHSSTKMHSDIWAGEPSNSVAIFIPIYGDKKNIDVKWIEPLTFPEELIQPLSDFNEGRHIVTGGTQYNVDFSPGDIILVDPYLIHATNKVKDLLRLSIDLRFITRSVVGNDLLAPGTRRVNYLTYEEWSDIGEGLSLTSNSPLTQFSEENSRQENTYAAKYGIKRFTDGKLCL